MFQRVAILGLNGSGKSTLAHALAKQTGYYELDVEDYYFPEQRESRRQLLDHCDSIQLQYLGELPFSQPRTKEEVQAALLHEIRTHSCFIFSCVNLNWSNEILRQIDIAFLLHTPTEERLNRIRSRDETRFGARVQPGGDMFAQQADFRSSAERRTIQSVIESAKPLQCPLIPLDGMASIEQNLQILLDQIQQNQ